MIRRSFIRQISAALGSIALHPTLEAALPHLHTPDAEGLQPDDPDFWKLIRQSFACSPTITNLNNGGVLPYPTHNPRRTRPLQPHVQRSAFLLYVAHLSIRTANRSAPTSPKPPALPKRNSPEPKCHRVAQYHHFRPPPRTRR